MSRIISREFEGRIVSMAMADDDGNDFADGQVALTFLVPADVIVAAGNYIITRLGLDGDDQ